MKVRWDGDVAYADREYVAAIYQVSEMTVRRYCTPVYREDRAGPGTGRAMYNVEECGTALGDVVARPWATILAMRTRQAVTRQQLRTRMYHRNTDPGEPEPGTPLPG
jgi:hypothetical protein